jgi:hypothetical protein
MVNRGFLAGLLIWGFAAFPLSAAMVSFLVIETGLPEECPASTWSSLWENGLLDVFFEEGHIVSNAPIRRLDGIPQGMLPDEARGDLDEAVEGGAEYFILALLEYPTPAGQEIRRPRTISLRVFRASPYRFIHEQRYAEAALPTMNEEFKSIKQSVRGLVPYLFDR